jgi:hypothetical protein
MSDKQKLFDFYEAELRSVIQFAAPFACEALAVEVMRKFMQEYAAFEYKDGKGDAFWPNERHKLLADMMRDDEKDGLYGE